MKMKQIKLLLFICLSSFIIYGCCKLFKDNQLDIQEGDVIFRCGGNPIALYTTLSPITHCGIIVKEGEQLKVLEATETVKSSSIDDFINKNLGICFIKRFSKNPIHIDYKKYIGIKYDNHFSLNNKEYYCSELVYDIYLKQLGIQLVKPTPLSEYNIMFLEDELLNRGISKDQLIVSPYDLFKSSKLKYNYEISHL